MNPDSDVFWSQHICESFWLLNNWLSSLLKCQIITFSQSSYSDCFNCPAICLKVLRVNWKWLSGGTGYQKRMNTFLLNDMITNIKTVLYQLTDLKCFVNPINWLIRTHLVALLLGNDKIITFMSSYLLYTMFPWICFNVNLKFPPKQRAFISDYSICISLTQT